MKISRRSKLFQLIFLSSLLACSACEFKRNWWKDAEESNSPPSLRISALSLKKQLQIDPSVANENVIISRSVYNTSWAQQNIAPAANLALQNINLSKIAFNEVGFSASSGRRLTSAPMIVGKLLFTLDGEGVVRAHSSENLQVMWQRKLPRKWEDNRMFGIKSGYKEGEYYGGNIAFGDGLLVISTGDGNVIALSPQDGRQIWWTEVKVPIRSAPLIQQGAVFFVTNDNKVRALSSTNGKLLWSKEGIKEGISVVGAPSPIAVSGRLIVPFSSGEIFAMEQNSGEVLWNASITGKDISGNVFGVSDIGATPVSDSVKVYSISSSNGMAAYEISSGRKVWGQDVSGTKTPWLTEYYSFFISSEDELICLRNSDGRPKWVQPIGDGNAKKKITWSGPVLAGSRLWIVSSAGKLLGVSPYNGMLETSIDVMPEIYLPPVVANGTLYLFNNEGDVAGYR